MTIKPAYSDALEQHAIHLCPHQYQAVKAAGMIEMHEGVEVIRFVSGVARVHIAKPLPRPSRQRAYGMARRPR